MSMPMRDMSFLHEELRRTASSRQRESRSMTLIRASWAESCIGDNLKGDMRLVLDELKKDKKKKKKERNAAAERDDRANEEEFFKLQEELKMRTQQRNKGSRTSLYGADGKLNGDSKARLEITKKDILDEIRRKSSNRRNTHASYRDEYGLLGSTKSQVMDELKKKSKKKRRNSLPRNDDSTHGGIPASRRSVNSDECKVAVSTQSQSSEEDARRRIAARSRPSDHSNWEDQERCTPRVHSWDNDVCGSGPRRFVPGSRSRSPVPRSRSKFEDKDLSLKRSNELQNDFKYNIEERRASGSTPRSPISKNWFHDAGSSVDGDSQENDAIETFEKLRDQQQESSANLESNDQEIRNLLEGFDDARSPVAPKRKDFIHFELKNRIKGPSRSRSLMYKYGKYEDESRSSLLRELETRVPRVAPRAYARPSLGFDKSSVHDELVSRYAENTRRSWSYSAKSSSSSDMDKHQGLSSLREHIRNRSRIDTSDSQKSFPRAMSGSYVPGGIVRKPRILGDADETVETQVTSDSELAHSESAFFIPGITGTARCLNNIQQSSQSTTSFQASSGLSTTSGGSERSSSGTSAGESKARSLDTRAIMKVRSGSRVRSGSFAEVEGGMRRVHAYRDSSVSSRKY